MHMVYHLKQEGEERKMKQKTFSFSDSYDAVRFLDGVAGSGDYKNARSVLVNVFTDRTDGDYIGYMQKLVGEKLGKAAVSGLTCQTGIAHGESLAGKTVFSVLFFDESDVELVEYDLDETGEDEAERDLRERIRKAGDLRGIQVYTTPLHNTKMHRFIAAAGEERRDIPIFGAGAGYGEKSKEKNPYVFGRGIHRNGLVAVLFTGRKLMIYAESSLGWTPIGRPMRATDVENDHILKTVDGETAGEVFKKYLGVVSSKHFIENTCEFPFMMKRGQKWIARMPIEKDGNGFIHFTADIRKGEKFFFSYGSKKVILKQTFNMAEYMSKKNLEALVIHVCRNRQIYLKDAENLELQAFSSFYRETAGSFAFSEILCRNGNGGLLNSAITAVGFKEFGTEEERLYSEDCYIEDARHGNTRPLDFCDEYGEIAKPRKDLPIPFEERIVNFLHATSRDLQAANMRLEEAATTDGLTRVFNRKKISERIEGGLKELGRAGGLNLIMFDIDNFKRINDTYGHDMGDEVLSRIAATAKGCIRKEDSIGRWGGEEFMILVPGVEKADAVAVAERIRGEINSIQWEKMPPVSVSLGVAEARADDDSKTLYKRVDNRLYNAKTHGKNRVVSEGD